LYSPVTARTIILVESIALEVKSLPCFETWIKERINRCWMSSTHPSQLYTVWSRYIVCGHRMHCNWNLQLFLSIYSKNRRSLELLWIPSYKLLTVTVTQQNKMAVALPAVERLLQTIPPWNNFSLRSNLPIIFKKFFENELT
jgi:hypothetical protein